MFTSLLTMLEQPTKKRDKKNHYYNAEVDHKLYFFKLLANILIEQKFTQKITPSLIFNCPQTPTFNIPNLYTVSHLKF